VLSKGLPVIGVSDMATTLVPYREWFAQSSTAIGMSIYTIGTIV